MNKIVLSHFPALFSAPLLFHFPALSSRHQWQLVIAFSSFINSSGHSIFTVHRFTFLLLVAPSLLGPTWAHQSHMTHLRGKSNTDKRGSDFAKVAVLCSHLHIHITACFCEIESTFSSCSSLHPWPPSLSQSTSFLCTTHF